MDSDETTNRTTTDTDKSADSETSVTSTGVAEGFEELEDYYESCGKRNGMFAS